MNLGTKHISSCSHGSLGRNHCIPGISFNVGSLLPSIQPLAQFCFPWFQLPGVNCGPEAGDPPSDTWSEGPNTTSQRLYPSPHYLSRYHLPSSQGGEAAQDWRNITWEENECSKRSLRENKNKTREIKDSRTSYCLLFWNQKPPCMGHLNLATDLPVPGSISLSDPLII
ncbi:uncharacterized protein LOC144616142 isoform X2 [Panthera onca]